VPVADIFSEPAKSTS